METQPLRSTLLAQFPVIYGIFIISLIAIVLTVGHLNLTSFFDAIGSSSNSAFYYDVLHPVRARIRHGLLLGGIDGFAISFIWFCVRTPRLLFKVFLTMLKFASALFLITFLPVGLLIWGQSITSYDPISDLALFAINMAPPILGVFATIYLNQLMRLNVQLSRFAWSFLIATFVIVLRVGLHAVDLDNRFFFVSVTGCLTALLLGICLSFSLKAASEDPVAAVQVRAKEPKWPKFIGFPVLATYLAAWTYILVPAALESNAFSNQGLPLIDPDTVEEGPVYNN